MGNSDVYISGISHKPRLMATNLQGFSHRPRAVGFRLRNRKDFIYEYGDAVVGPEDRFDYSDAFEDISESGEDDTTTKEGGEESSEKKE